MKAIGTALLDHYAGRAHTLARLWKVIRQDGEVFGFTDHNEAITYDLIVYQPSSVFDASAIATRGDMNVDNLEAQGLLDSDGITAADIEHGLWDGAAVEILEVNYRDLGAAANILRVGDLGQIKRRQGIYVAEMRGLMQKLQNNFIRLVTPGCNADLGDDRCQVSLAAYTVTGSVSSVTSSRKFVIASGQGDGYFNFGKITFTSGLNDGLSMEVNSYLNDGTLETFLPMPYAVAPGDNFTIYPGCNKVHAANIEIDSSGDEEKVWYGDCKNKFGNVINFRGFPGVPGQDRVQLFGGQS